MMRLAYWQYDERECAVCGRITSYWCSRCEDYWLCSQKCNYAAWPKHKLTCNPLPTVTALYFPAHSTSNKPVIVPIKCRHLHNDPSSPCPLPRVLPYFSANSPERDAVEIDSLTITMGLGAEALRFPLQVWYDKHAVGRGQPVNRCIERLTGGKAYRPWGGDVVVVKFSGSRQQNYTDASLVDLPPLVNYFLEYR